MGKLKKFWQSLGPGLITGAADDDPSGIVTYAVAGARYGLATLWTALVTLPFIIIIQRMCGRIGLISGKGLAGNMKKYYPRWLLIIIALLITVSSIINIGADISAMSATINLFAPNISPIIFSLLIPAVIILALVLLSYRQIANHLKWVALVMFSYVLATFMVRLDWPQIIYRTFVPGIVYTRDYLLMTVAVFGTTISPYLFFWEASGVVEKERVRKRAGDSRIPCMIPSSKPHTTHRSQFIVKNEISSMYKDVGLGMIFSNLITFFIIVLTASTIFRSGPSEIKTVQEIASVLRPVAGPYSNFLFLIGILAAGALAIPVLAGSAAYALAEMFGWRWGFDSKFHRAPQFYLIIIISTILGVMIPLLNLHPIDILIYTAVIYGAISPLLILLVIHMANNPKIMGKYTSRKHSNIIAYILFLIMTASVILMFIL